MAVYAETVLRNGTVWCGRHEGTAEAVALWGGRVLATGSNENVAPLIGLIWLVGRIVYLRAYMADPEKRLIGAGLGGLTNLIMFIIAAAGVVRACLAAT